MAEKEYIERYDEDFLGNKINIGDMVIFEAPGYRSFTIGEVITKAPKSCQIEYINDWNYEGRKEIVRQGYGQIIKHPAADVTEVRHGEWVKHDELKDDFYHHRCSICKEDAPFHYVETEDYDEGMDGEFYFIGMCITDIVEHLTNYCPNCGAKMDGKRKADNE